MRPIHFRSSERQRLLAPFAPTNAGSARARAVVPVGRALDAFDRALTVTLVYTLLDAWLWLALYLRPGPTGAPFALDPWHYLGHAFAYSVFGVLLPSLPFLAYASRLRGGDGHVSWQLSTLTSFALLGQLDRELQRFMGTHLSLDWATVYLTRGKPPSAILEALRDDARGPYSSVAMALVVLACAPLASAASRHLRWPRPGRRYDLALIAFFVVVPALVWNLPGGHGRQNKVRPASLLVLRELTTALVPRPVSKQNVHEATRRYRAHWSSLDPTGGWTFPDPTRPLYRVPTRSSSVPPTRAPSFVVVVLETFRARDVGAFAPSAVSESPTPFLDSLARAPESAAYVRCVSNALPTVYAFMAIHTGIPGHSRRAVASGFTHLELDSFPAALRRHGYRAMLFTGSDPDWDNQRVFADRWYDEVHYDPSDRERDALVFRRAAERIREVGRTDRPFVATLFSISNHYPFREPGGHAVAIDLRRPIVERLHDTMRYTDSALAELVDSLRDEPFFDDTILIVTGDHGYDLGDSGTAGGHTNLRHESVWVPLVIHGHDARLPRGERAEVSSHVDLAPTILELAGFVEPNVFVGHSLLHPSPNGGEAFSAKDGSHALETRDLVIVENVGHAPVAYAGVDRLQSHALPVPSSALAHARNVADFLGTVVDFTYENDRLAPR